MEHNSTSYCVDSFFQAPSIPLEPPSFPIEALPNDIADIVRAVADSTQTPVDMSAAAALAVLSTCVQSRYVICPKPDWFENLNLFLAVFLPPSERKSAVFKVMSKPIIDFQADWNRAHDAEIRFNSSQRSILNQRLKMLESMAVKGKASMEDVRKASEELAKMVEKHELQLICDDITTEKLEVVLAQNGGVASLFSAEGGFFDILRGGMYSRSVNIDAVLKAYSGDAIRVDRIGRDSETICNPRLTVMIMAQPRVLEELMNNDTFRGKGLTARFLYCVPESKVGSRRYRTDSIPPETEYRYAQCIRTLLLSAEPTEQLEIIRLTPEADAQLEAFAEELEPKLVTEYAAFSDWAGKLVGTIARIAGILCAVEHVSWNSFAAVEQLAVSGDVMSNAIRIGRFYLEQAKVAFSYSTGFGTNKITQNCKIIMNAIERNNITEFTRRDLMRLCRGIKTAEEMQLAIDRLVDCGYFAAKPAETEGSKGRPTVSYLLNHGASPRRLRHFSA